MRKAGRGSVDPEKKKITFGGFFVVFLHIFLPRGWRSRDAAIIIIITPLSLCFRLIARGTNFRVPCAPPIGSLLPGMLISFSWGTWSAWRRRRRPLNVLTSRSCRRGAVSQSSWKHENQGPLLIESRSFFSSSSRLLLFKRDRADA